MAAALFFIKQLQINGKVNEVLIGEKEQGPYICLNNSLCLKIRPVGLLEEFWDFIS